MLSNKKIIYWDSLHKEVEIDISDYIIPTKEILPEWWKGIIAETHKFHGKKLNSVVQCPSYQDMFYKTYTFISPCDMTIEVSRFGFNFRGTDERWLHLSTHTINDKTNHQLGKLWDEDLVNLKINTNLIIQPKNHITKIFYLPSFYHDPRAELILAPGIMEMSPEQNAMFNFNFFVDLKEYSKTETKIISIDAGQPLACLYIDEGNTIFKKNYLKFKPKKKFSGEWLKNLRVFKNKQKEKKCPFHF
jgi:hypothetical protein